jgi:hypothetical protein
MWLPVVVCHCLWICSDGAKLQLHAHQRVSLGVVTLQRCICAALPAAGSACRADALRVIANAFAAAVAAHPSKGGFVRDALSNTLL